MNFPQISENLSINQTHPTKKKPDESKAKNTKTKYISKTKSKQAAPQKPLSRLKSQQEKHENFPNKKRKLNDNVPSKKTDVEEVCKDKNDEEESESDCDTLYHCEKCDNDYFFSKRWVFNRHQSSAACTLFFAAS